MSRLDTLDYTADFLRGWPNEGAIESSIYPIASGVDLEAGDLVEVSDNGGVTELVLNTTESNAAGIVVRGNLDDKSVAASGKAIVLWGGYIVRTTKIGAGLSVGDSVSAIAGVFDTATSGAAPATLPAPLGTVLEVGTDSEGTDYAVIVVR